MVIICYTWVLNLTVSGNSRRSSGVCVQNANTWPDSQFSWSAIGPEICIFKRFTPNDSDAGVWGPLREAFVWRTLLINTLSHLIKIFSKSERKVPFLWGNKVKIWASISHVIDVVCGQDPFFPHPALHRIILGCFKIQFLRLHLRRFWFCALGWRLGVFVFKSSLVLFDL